MTHAFAGRWEQLLVKSGLRVLLALNDKVTVTPTGGTAISAIVGKVTANVDLVRNRIWGLGPANRHLLVGDAAWQGWGYNCTDCGGNALTNGSGVYTYNFKADLVAGDYVSAALVDAAGNQTIANGFSRTPAITMGTYPVLFRIGRSNIVNYTISGAAHVQNTFIGWDGVTRPDLRYLITQGPNYNWWPGISGPYTVDVHLGTRGTLYFRAFVYADGQWAFSSPEKSAPVR